MGGFTSDEGKHLQDFLGGRRADQARRKKKRDADFAQNPGRVLREELLTNIERAAAENQSVYQYRVEEIIGSFWKSLSEKHRQLVTAELARRGSPITDPGEALALNYYIAELKRRGYRVSTVSKWSHELVMKVMNDVGDLEIGPVYELVVKRLDTGAWQQRGPLKLMGYKVGQNGLSTRDRRKILRDTIRVRLVADFDDIVRYIAAWGPPLSPQRLDKIIASISRSLSLAEKKTRADYSKAINDWQEDLGWLMRAYDLIPQP